MSERVCFVANPHSAGGRTGRKLPAVRAAAARHLGDFELWETEHPGHGSALAAKAVEQGFDLVVAVGGDGTAHEVANGLFEGRELRREGIAFGVLPAGTGSDLVRTLGMPSDPEEAVQVFASGKTRACDVAFVTCETPEGQPASRICVNVCGFGVQGDVVYNVNQGSKRLGGTVTFLAATLKAVLGYRAGHTEVSWTDAEGASHSWSGDLINCFVANGQYCGGGMRLSRESTLQDGLLELVLVPDLPRRYLIPRLPRLYTGQPEKVGGLVTARVREVRAQASQPTRVDIDGEQPGLLAFSATVLDRSLPIRSAWS